VKHDANAPSPMPLGSEGRDGAFDFARRQDSGEAPEGSSAAVEEILAELPDRFRTAMQAQADFLKWLSSGDHSIAELARRLHDVVVAGQPFAQGYDAVEGNFPLDVDAVHDRLRSVKEEVLPGESIEGEGTPGLTLAGGAGHA
jgi:hypothetical protein